MALGQAAGVAACLSVEDSVSMREVDVSKLQRRLLEDNTVLFYFNDVKPGDAHQKALQYFAVFGFYPITAWEAKLSEPVTQALASEWIG